MKSMTFFISLFFVVAICSGQVNIMVNHGPFPTVQEAAKGEAEVNFFDENLSDDRACTECFAAMELAAYLTEAGLFAKEAIKFPDLKAIPEKGAVFIIGSRISNSLIAHFSSAGKQIFTSEQSFSIRSFLKNGRVITIIEGADRAGTLYGVYSYLDELGVKFIGLGKKGTIIPSAPAGIPSTLDIVEDPSYLTRGFYTWNDRKTDPEFFLWMARNKLNYWTAQEQPVNMLKKLGIKLSDGGHRIQGVVFDSDSEYPYNHPLFKGDENKPDDPYNSGNEYTGDSDNDGKLSNFEAHPEWYGMKDGKRIKIEYSDNAAQSGTNFCTSNADARKEFAKRIAGQLIDGKWKYVDVFEFWTFDGGANLWCTCDRCKSAGTCTDKLFTVTYDILKELERVHSEGILSRRVEVSANAYHATLDPPSSPLPSDYDYKNSSLTFFPIGRCFAHTFADPSCAEINQWQLKAYNRWTMGEKRNYKGSIFIGEYYNVSSFKSLPLIFTKIMSVDIPWYYHNGARQFNYMHTPDTLWGTWTLNQYLMGKLLWNVNINAEKVIDEYFTSCFPTTHETTVKYYQHLETASENSKILKHYVETDSVKRYTLATGFLKGELFPLRHMQYNEYHPLLNDGPDVIEMMNAMDMAKQFIECSLIKCKDPVEMTRLIEDKNIFDYGYAMYRYIYHMIRTSVFHKKGDKLLASMEFKVVEKYAGELEKMVDVVRISSDHSNALNGFDATRSVQAFNEFKKLYGKTGE